MKKLFFLILVLVLGLSANAQVAYFPTQENKELADSLEQFVASRQQLANPFTFIYKGEEMLIYRSANGRSACYAYFTISPGSGCVGDMFTARVIFVTGTAPWTVQWSNGATTPEIQFAATGPFQLNCTAFDATNCSVSNSQPITAVVSPNPSLSLSRMGKDCYNIFTANTNNCEYIMWSNGSVGYTAEFLPGNGYAFASVENTFGCIAKDSILLSPPCNVVDTIHVIDTTYLTVWDTIGCNGENGLIPVPNIIVSNNEGCGPIVVNFSDNSSNQPTEWHWIFPGGNPSTSTLQNPVVEYANEGYYGVSLSVGNANGMSEVYHLNNVVHVTALKPVVTASVSRNPIEPGEVVGLSAFVEGGGFNYSFQWNNQSTLNWPTHQNPVAVPYVTTTYTVVVTDLATGCTGSASVTVIVLGTVANKEAEKIEVNVFPNPTTDIVNVTLPDGDYEVSIVSERGTTYGEFSVSGNFSVNRKEYNLSDGIYFLIISTQNNQVVRKVVFQ